MTEVGTFVTASPARIANGATAPSEIEVGAAIALCARRTVPTTATAALVQMGSRRECARRVRRIFLSAGWFVRVAWRDRAANLPKLQSLRGLAAHSASLTNLLRYRPEYGRSHEARYGPMVPRGRSDARGLPILGRRRVEGAPAALSTKWGRLGFAAAAAPAVVPPRSDLRLVRESPADQDQDDEVQGPGARRAQVAELLADLSRDLEGRHDDPGDPELEERLLRCEAGALRALD